MIVKSLFLLALMIPGLDDQSSTRIDSTATYYLSASAISASVADVHLSPLRLENIDSLEVLSNATGHTFPEIIHNVPGVYATSSTGNYGDATINIRGFKQENISVLLNGLPISGLTSGSMYWNNWMGLSDATSSIQLQKGIGNSMLSDNSVGGTINIITTLPSERFLAGAAYSFTGYGTNSLSINADSGDLGKGWSFTVKASHDWGKSYVDCSALSSWSYYLSLVKKINANHSLNFLALGAPETHQQRSSRLSYQDVATYGIFYNKSWGYQTGADGVRFERTTAQNNYFKPYFTLTHSYTGNVVNVVTSLYGAWASGGGYYSESTGKRISSFVIPSGNAGAGQIDWDGVYAFNASQTPGEYGKAAQNIMSDYLAGHTQAGVKSSVTYDKPERLSVEAGLHFQYYGTWEKEQITDLLGADYWYENYEKNSLAGLAGRNPIKKVGDYVRTDNGRTQLYGTLYALATYKAGPRQGTVLTLGLSGSGTGIQRWDDYNYLPSERLSDWAAGAGGSVKAGVLQRLSLHTSAYLNAAFYSRVPYYNVFFASGNNSISKNVTNEKNYLTEAGVRSVFSNFSVEGTFYLAYWQDKSLASNPYKSLEEEPCKYLVTGLDALHYGFELEASYSPWKWLDLDLWTSIGDWRWKNDVTATIYDPVSRLPVQTINVYADGLHVGDSPQTQVGAGLGLKPVKGLFAGLEWTFNDRMWADFDPATRTDPNDRNDSYRVPSYHMLNLSISWTQDIKHFGYTIFFNANNLLDSRYIERGKDGTLHDESTFTGYWGNSRNVNFGLRLKFF